METKEEMPKRVIKAAVIILLSSIAVHFACTVLLVHLGDSQVWPIIMQSVESGNDTYGIMADYYTPLWGYMLAFLSMLNDLFGAVPVFGDRFTELLPYLDTLRSWKVSVISPELNMAIKFPLGVFDAAVGWQIFCIVRKYRPDRDALIAMAMWCFCPICIYMTAVQGQFDCVCVLLFLLAVRWAGWGRPFAAGMAFALSVWLKVFPAVAILALTGYVWSIRREHGDQVRQVLLAVLGASIVSVVVMLPPLMEGELDDVFLFLTARTADGGDPWYFIIRQALMALLIIGIMLWSFRKSLRDRPAFSEQDLILISGALIAMATLLHRGYQYAPETLAFMILAYGIAEDRRGYYAAYTGFWFFAAAEAALHAGPAALTIDSVYYGWFALDPFVALAVAYGNVDLTLLEGACAAGWTVFEWMFVALALYDASKIRLPRAGPYIDRIRTALTPVARRRAAAGGTAR
ncbi:MAG: glycosyltransferase family 87 protein [Methanomethylophilus sp.]|jgi:hypothetical protein